MRHGQSIADVEQRFGNQAKDPLTGLGRKQAALAAQWIKAKFQPCRIVSSALARAKETAETVAALLGVPVEYEPDLIERNNGELANLTKAEAHARGLIPPERPDYLPHESVAGGETLIEFGARAETFWSRLLSQSKAGQRILIVSHGQMIEMLFRCFLNLPLDDCVRLMTSDTGIHDWSLRGLERRIRFSNSQVHLDLAGMKSPSIHLHDGH